MRVQWSALIADFVHILWFDLHCGQYTLIVTRPTFTRHASIPYNITNIIIYVSHIIIYNKFILLLFIA